jgi:RimJ/RimL family protein N-acetyltransferase
MMIEMILNRYDEPRRFHDAVAPFLLRNEALNCVFLGVLGGLVAKPKRTSPYYLCAVHQAKRVAGAAFFTPPYFLGLSEMPGPAVDWGVRAALRWPDRRGGIFGPRATAFDALAMWGAHAPPRLEQRMDQRVYRAAKVTDPEPGPGEMRFAGPGDQALLEAWNHEFILECNLREELPRAAEEASSAIRNASRALWLVEGRPVAMAGFTGDTPSGIRIGWVYTPRDERKKGHASRLVTALTRELFQRGKRFCFLYTDLSNPISNRIYERIGYRPVGDFAYLRLG